MGNLTTRSENPEGGGDLPADGPPNNTRANMLTTSNDTLLNSPPSNTTNNDLQSSHNNNNNSNQLTTTTKPSATTTTSGNTEQDPVDILERLFGDRGGVPMVFRWEGGGDDVFLTGTFNNWSAKIPMSRSGNDFVLIQELSRGKHAYKFIVDDEWRFSSEEQTMTDRSGNINNFVDLSEFKPKFENLVQAKWQQKLVDQYPYGHTIPDFNDYTKEPAQMPAHMRNVYLNKTRRGGVPLLVTLDHLYCTARQNGLMALGMSQRYRQKFFTTVYICPVSGGFPLPKNKQTSSTTSTPSNVAPTIGVASGVIPRTSTTQQQQQSLQQQQQQQQPSLTGGGGR
jgi:hypothetical protein